MSEPISTKRVVQQSNFEKKTIWMDKTVKFWAVRFNNLRKFPEPSYWSGVMQITTPVMHLTIYVNTSGLPLPVGMTSSAFVSVNSKYYV